MNLDSVSLKAIINEARPLLAEGILQKISQISRYDLLLCFRKPGHSYKLIVNLQAGHTRFCLVDGKMPPAQEPTGFIMHLRKRLIGKRLLELQQAGLERTVILSFPAYSLVFELPGKQNNAILLNEEQKVTAMLFTESRGERLLRLGHTFRHLSRPDKPDISSLSYSQIVEQLSLYHAQAAAQSIKSAFFGIPLRHINQICQDAALEPETALDEESITRLAICLDQWCQRLLEGEYEPVSFPNGTVSPWSLGQPGEMRHATMQDAMECDMALPGVEEVRRQLQKLVEKALQRAQGSLKARLGDLEKANIAPNYRLKGELLLAYLSQIADKAKMASLPDGHGNLVDIELNEQLTPSENAQKYFKEFKRLKRAQAALKEPIAQAEAEVSFIEEVLLSINTASSAEELEAVRRLWEEERGVSTERCRRHIQVAPLGPRRFRHDGFLILVGRNPRQNDKLTVKIASDGDLWFHARGIPGAHVVLRTSGRVPELATVEAAASLAAKYSKASESTVVIVSYTDAKHVRKPKGSPPGRVVMKTERTITVSPHNLSPDLQEEPSVPSRNSMARSSCDEEPAVIASNSQEALPHPMSLAGPFLLPANLSRGLQDSLTQPEARSKSQTAQGSTPSSQDFSPTLKIRSATAIANSFEGLAIQPEDSVVFEALQEDKSAILARNKALQELSDQAEQVHKRVESGSSESLDELKAQAQLAISHKVSSHKPGKAYPEPIIASIPSLG